MIKADGLTDAPLGDSDKVRVGYFAIARMSQELSEIVGRTVDLRTPAELHPSFRGRVQAEAFVEYAAA